MMYLQQIDNRIRKLFSLEGRLSQNDKKIYLAIYKKLQNEIFVWLEDQVSEEEKGEIEKKIGELEQMSTDEMDIFSKIFQYILQKISHIPNGEIRLLYRLNHYVNNLAVKTALSHRNMNMEDL